MLFKKVEKGATTFDDCGTMHRFRGLRLCTASHTRTRLAESKESEKLCERSRLSMPCTALQACSCIRRSHAYDTQHDGTNSPRQ